MHTRQRLPIWGVDVSRRIVLDCAPGRRGFVPAELQALFDRARGRGMSPSEQEAQRRSFADGNAHIENERVTREMVNEAAQRLSR